MAELKKSGLYIAQGPETNVLIKVEGKAPLLEIVGAIDLNEFNRTGKAKELDKNSIEVLDIMSCPEKYCFESPSITDAIKNEEGLNKKSGRDADTVKESEYDNFIAEYKRLHQLYPPAQAEPKFALWLKQKHNISLNSSQFVISKIKKMLNKSIAEL